MKAALLLVDEMSCEPVSREEATLFLRVVSYRYGRGSMCITSNEGIADWAEMLAGDEVSTAAIPDRLLRARCVLNVKGRRRRHRLRDLDDIMRASG